MSELANVLTVDAVTAGYGGAPVTRGVELKVNEGEIVSLLGANGAGKTTTLRTIAGMIRPVAGRILFEGRDLAGLSATVRTRMGISHVPEGRGVFFGLTVAEHFRCRYSGERVDEELAYTLFPALGHLRNRRVRVLELGPHRCCERQAELPRITHVISTEAGVDQNQAVPGLDPRGRGRQCGRSSASCPRR